MTHLSNFAFGERDEQSPKTPAQSILRFGAQRTQTSRHHAIGLGVILRYLKKQPSGQGHIGNGSWGNGSWDNGSWSAMSARTSARTRLSLGF